MIIDFETDNLPNKMFDVCIVGAGAAGLTLAHKLLRDGRSIVLLEGGGSSRWERKSQGLNKSQLHGQRFAGAHSGRFRTLGGTTSAWAGQVKELDELDFRRRDWVQGSSWPIKKSDLRRFYVQASELEGTATLVQDDEQIRQCVGLQERPLDDDLGITFSRFCPERKFARVFAGTISDNRLIIMLHANVVEMVPSEDRQRITSLRFRTISGKEAFCVARLIVLCVGGIESSRLLLNQSFAPWNEHGLVGRYFHDHIQCFAADVNNANLQSPNWLYGPRKLRGEYFPKVQLLPAAQEKYKVLNVAGVIEYDDGVIEALRSGIKLLAGPISAIGLKEFVRMSPRVPIVVWHHFKIKKDPDYILPLAKPRLSVYCEQLPLSESRIALSHKRDKLGLFRADITWRISELEIETIRKYVAIIQRSFAAQGIADVIPDPDLHSNRIFNKCIDQFHHCGGTRMAAEPQSGVVDPDLRLNGTRNTYVCSSSVFPSSGYANPTHTIIALAARLAEHLNGVLAAQGGD